MQASPGQATPVAAGVGLRAPHYREILTTRPRIGWLEAHSENYFGAGGPALAMLEAVRSHYPISLHGVGLSLGSSDPLRESHLQKLRQLVRRIEPCFVSEHLSWSSVDGRFFNELLPLPYSEEALRHMIERVSQLQDFLGRRVLIENITAYVQFQASTIPEWEFLNALTQATGCGLLLDINNVYVNSVNHAFDARAFLVHIDPSAVEELHLAGFDQADGVLVDTHGARVAEAVWDLYAFTLARIGPRPTLIEWDNALPEFQVLLQEAQHANALLERVHVHAA